MAVGGVRNPQVPLRTKKQKVVIQPVKKITSRGIVQLAPTLESKRSKDRFSHLVHKTALGVFKKNLDKKTFHRLHGVAMQRLKKRLHRTPNLEELVEEMQTLMVKVVGQKARGKNYPSN